MGDVWCPSAEGMKAFTSPAFTRAWIFLTPFKSIKKCQIGARREVILLSFSTGDWQSQVVVKQTDVLSEQCCVWIGDLPVACEPCQGPRSADGSLGSQKLGWAELKLPGCWRVQHRAAPVAHPALEVVLLLLFLDGPC